MGHNILGLSDDEFLRNQRESFYDRKYQQALEAVTEQGAEDALGGEMGGGDLGDGLGGDELGGDELGGDDLGGDLGGAEPAAEESPLLAAPGRRNDMKEGDANERDYAKSSYKTVAQRGGDQRRSGRSGPNSKTIKALHNVEALRGETSRSRKPQGYIPDVRFGLEEQKQSTYNTSETRLLENTRSVRKLVEQLEKKEAQEDEA